MPTQTTDSPHYPIHPTHTDLTPFTAPSTPDPPTYSPTSNPAPRSTSTPPTPTPSPTPDPMTANHGYAHLPLPTLSTTDIRILSHNINTLHTTTTAELSATFDLYSEFTPTILGLQETNKNWKLYDRTEGPLRDIVTRRWPGAKVITAHCHDKIFTGPHQPGGVAQIVFRQLTGRVTSRGADTLGRFAWQQILLDGVRTLFVITAYRVTQDSVTSCGHETFAMQQWRKLRNDECDNPNPRQQTLEALQAFITPRLQDGHEIIIMTDANSPANDTAIEAFLEATELHDLMAAYLPDPPPPTYQRGQAKIDHIWGTIGVLTATINAGILPFGAGPRSDHAILHLDISMEALTGIPSQSLHDPTHPASRNLWSTDIKAAKQYVTLVTDGFQAENISLRTSILVSRCDRTKRCSQDDIRILNKIDNDITKILLNAETECKKARGHAWSPLLATAGRTVIAAKWHLSDVLNNRLQISLWNRAEAIIHAKAQLKAAYAVLRQVQRDAKKIRDSFLDDRAEHLAETRQIDKATAVRQLLRAERQAAIFKRLGIWNKGNEHLQLDRILAPDDPDDPANSTWTAIVEAQALHEILTHEGQRHFRQAADTPFVTGPIAEKIGPFDDNEYCDAILNGTFDFTDLELELEVADLIRGMQYPDPANPTPPINIIIDDETFRDAVYHTRERTSSSPSGRHYGHYLTLLRAPEILSCIKALTNFCFR